MNGEAVEKILVVDDEEDLEVLVRQRFRRRIRKGELNFAFAHNGQEALDMLDADPDISLVLSDINMPVMDGLALLEQLGKAKPDIRAVIVSAYGDMANIRTAMNRGAFDFVTKPIDFTDIEVTIDKTLKHIKLMREALASRDRLVALDRELDVAREMQASLLSRRFPADGRYDVHALMVPAKEVGGDFYDFFRLSDTKVGLVVADVSGKGVPAALFMMVSRTLLKGSALGGTPPSICMREVNELLCEENEACMFVTLFYGIFDLESGVLRYCNAGHTLPRVVRGDGGVDVAQGTGDVALGVVEGIGFGDGEIELRAGDTLFLYSDGVSEAHAPNDSQLGEDRLDEFLASVGALPSEDLNARVLERVREFAQDAPQFDDITCMALRYGERAGANGGGDG